MLVTFCIWFSVATFFINIKVSQSYITPSFLHLRSQRYHISQDSSYSHQVLCATSSKSISSKVSDANNSPKESENEEFLAWEKEELELWEVEQQLQRTQIIDDDSNEDGLPRYMNEMLSEYGNPLMENNDPTPVDKLPIIAVIGRPNTGKSTIVNKLTNSYKDGAIVHDEPGITRDRTYRSGSWCEYNFQVVDTGGIIFDDTDDIFAERITQQALLALSEATVALFVCDGKEGLTQLDKIVADWLRKNNRIPTYVLVNKCESETVGITQAQEFWELGLGQPWPVSGIHGTGLGEVLDEVTTKHMVKVTHVLKENATNIALIGRPNVGKSSLFNKLFGKDRSIVSEVAGTTRDTIDEVITRSSGRYRIVDTAGIRRRGKVDYGAEYFMVNRAFKAIKRADVIILLLDAIDGIVEQDRLLADRIASEGRACVIALNKWDAVPNKDDKTYLKAVENIRSNLPVLRWAEIVLISATTGQRTEKLFESIDRSCKQYSRRVSTAIINEVVNEATMWMAPPTVGSRSGRIYYSMQIGASPPTIVFFVNDPALFTDTYQRYLERKIRDALDLEGTPIKMIWRGKALRDVGRAARKGDSVPSNIRGGIQPATGSMMGLMTGKGDKSEKKSRGKGF